MTDQNLTASQYLNDKPKISLPVRALLCVNVGVFRVVQSISPNSANKNNYHPAGTSVFIILLAEYFITNLSFPRFMDDNITWFFINAVTFHGLLGLLFIPEIIVMAKNYDLYYNKGFSYLSVILFLAGIAGLLVVFNNQIGHVTK